VRFTTPGAQQFPNDPDQPGRIMGAAWSTGDELTYLVLVDDKDVGNGIILTRSSVYYDDESNRQLHGRRRYPRDPPPNHDYHIDDWDLDPDSWEDDSSPHDNNDHDSGRSEMNEEGSNDSDISLTDDGSEDGSVISVSSDITDQSLNHNVLNDLANYEDKEINETTHLLYSEEGTFWEVEKIIGHRVKKHKPHLKVKWTIGDPSWESFEKLRKTYLKWSQSMLLITNSRFLISHNGQESSYLSFRYAICLSID